MRPEAWLLIGLYLLWMRPGRRRGAQRFGYAALAAIGPVVWAATDCVVTGDPLFSLHPTRATWPRSSGAQAACRRCPAATVQLPAATLDKMPVFFAGSLGLALAICARPAARLVAARDCS